MATTPLEILCLAAEKRAVQDLNTNSDKLIADPSFGEAWDLAVGNVIAIVQQAGQRAYNPQSWAGWTSVTVSLGNGPIPPLAGVWYLLSNRPLTSGTVTASKRFKIIAYASGDDFANIGAASNATGVVFMASGTTPTTWTHGSQLQEITTDLQFNATASDVQSALNATAFITSDGGVKVTQDTFYFVLWNDAGARALLAGFAGELAPLSIVEVAQVDDGSTITELQIVRVIQNAASFVELTTDSDAASITIDEVQAGGSGLNAKYRATLSPQPYDGGFTITIRGIESAPIAWNADGPTFQAALENISINHGTLITGAKYKIVSFQTSDDFTNVGASSNATGIVFTATNTTPTTWTHLSVLSPVAAGNVFVNKEADGQYFFVFQGDMANTDMGTVTGDPTGLQVTPYKLGVLNFDTPGCALLLGGAQSVETFLSVTAIPPGDSYPRELFRRGVTLQQGINYPGYSSPQPNNLYWTATQSDARYLRQDANSALQSGNTLTFSSGSTLDFQGSSTGTFAIANTSGAATKTGYSGSVYVSFTQSSNGYSVYDLVGASLNLWEWRVAGNTLVQFMAGGAMVMAGGGASYGVNGAGASSGLVRYSVDSNSGSGSGISWEATNTLGICTNSTVRITVSNTAIASNIPMSIMTTTVSGLPAASIGAGYRAFVTDSNATLAAGIGNTVAGSGSNKVPVFSDGTNWIIG